MFSFIGIDALIKKWVLETVAPLTGSVYPFGGVGIFDIGGISCSLNLVFNTGAAWGIFSDYSNLLLIGRICIVFALFGYLIVQKISPWSLWWVATGAVGNIIDMLAYGHVIDFVHLRFWGWTFPLFNGADAMITLGICCWMMNGWKKGKFHAP